MKLHFFRSHLVKVFLTFALAFLGFLAFSSNAEAQNYRAGLGGPYGRIFPEAALRGAFKVIQYPIVEIDGKQERLAPGSRIMDTSNRIVMPATLTGKPLIVNFVRFSSGQVHTVWMLTKKEVSEPRRLANPKWWHRLYKKVGGSVVDMAKWLGLSQLGL